MGSLRTRLLVGIVVPVLVFAIGAGYLLAALGGIEASVTRVRDSAEAVHQSLRLASAAREQYNHVAHVLLLPTRMEEEHLHHFGEAVREVGPGPGWHMPWPVEQVLKPSVTQIRKEEFGFRTVDVGPPARYRQVQPEALMLTGDGNIIKGRCINYLMCPQYFAESKALRCLRPP